MKVIKNYDYKRYWTGYVLQKHHMCYLNNGYKSRLTGQRTGEVENQYHQNTHDEENLVNYRQLGIHD